ncbi:bifunctional nuclease family protein [Chloroflexota bacterium]
MLEMSIDSIRVSVVNSQRVVILKESQSDRYLPIWIGSAEADAIAIKLQGVSVPRPMTHDLLYSMITALGATINFVLVSDLQNDTFYAKIYLNVDGREIEIDSRPSDAIAIAVRAQTPIYVEEQVLEKAGIIFDQETGKPIPSSQTDEFGGKKEISAEELGKLSAFADFIDTLDLKDLDKGKAEDQ